MRSKDKVENMSKLKIGREKIKRKKNEVSK
jgi:hypothetical protein